jgi:hypothetical protein
MDMKKIYFATVCFLPLVLLTLGLAAYWHVPFLVSTFFCLEIYGVVGLLAVVVDLWRSDENVGKKVIWTLLILPLRMVPRWILPLGLAVRWFWISQISGYINLIALPIYWFLMIRQKVPKPVPVEAAPSDPSLPSPKWVTISKRALIALAAVVVAPMVIPKTNIESFQEVAASVVALYPIVAPALIVSAILCFIFKRSRWITAFWIFVTGPVIVLFCLLGSLMHQTGQGSGPDWGFVGMGTGFVLLFSLPEVIPGILLLCACPPKEMWQRTTMIVCVISTGLSLGSLFLGIRFVVRWETVPPTNEAEATAFAENYVHRYPYGRGGGYRGPAFIALLHDPKTPVSTLTKIANLLPNDSRYWQTLALNTSLPRVVIEAKITEPRIAGYFASSPYTAPEYLKVLAESPDQNVRIFVARNTSTPQESLEKLAQDKDSLIRTFARQNLAGTLGEFAYRKETEPNRSQTEPVADTIAQCEAALRINPKDEEARVNLGNALLKIPGRLPQAIALYEAALKINPADANARENLALARKMMTQQAAGSEK